MPNLKKKISFCLGFILLGVSPSLIFAQQQPINQEVTPEITEQILHVEDYQRTEEKEAQEPQTEEEPEQEVDPREVILEFIKNRLDFDLSVHERLKEQQKETKEKLVQINQKITSLQGQIEYLENQTKFTQEKIKNVKRDKAKTENKIIEILEEIEVKKILFEEEKNTLLEYLSLIYHHENTYGGADDQLNTVKLLLSQDSVSQILKQKTYLDILKSTSQDILTNIDKFQNELQIQQNFLENQQMRLIYLDKQMETEKANLQMQRSAKETLLRETQNKEEIFQQLLIEAKKQEEKVLEEINALRNNIELINNTTSGLEDTLSPEQYEKVLRIKTVLAQKEGVKETGRFEKWPVPVELGFSAFFEDGNYESLFGVQHQALDIPIIQGSPIAAPADAIVLKATDNGLGYSYVVLAHENGLITVYGHVFAIMVKEGDFIEKEQIFALSGGIPGTKGAGYRTTGAHLHLEVHYQGERVDPLIYFPLEKINPDFIPNEYWEFLGIEKPKIKVKRGKPEKPEMVIEMTK